MTDQFWTTRLRWKLARDIVVTIFITVVCVAVCVLAGLAMELG